ncbi:MAG: putative deoxynucleotide monophosphate kinase [Prokaryotic dsDNA virus sp.]|jgi:hypothetical protein|nr:MAG: putative deoxynucleotide monophosphate kinase [Prokaryotic dsDNA virus sp.]|tara:strand:+ start:62723 stop:63310 length:588 start_codon:yes stop_codon:yes gene_type:complete
MNPLSNKIILLNAPKGAGKDTIGRCLKNLYQCELRAFKTALYECAYPFSDCRSYEEFIHFCTDREYKESKMPQFRGMSPREFLIYISEEIAKPHFGKRFFGQKSAKSISLKDFERGVVFTDSGFVEEVLPLISEFGGKNIYIVQFSGQGSNDFSGDSRNFIKVREAHTIKMRTKNEDIIPENFARLITQEIIKYG